MTESVLFKFSKILISSVHEFIRYIEIENRMKEKKYNQMTTKMKNPVSDKKDGGQNW